MRAITLHQPWASLIAIGVKQFETRAYPPPRKLLGKRIAIHAAARLAALTAREMSRTADGHRLNIEITARLMGAGLGNLWCDLPHGAVVCTAIISGAYRIGETWTSPRHGEMVVIAEVMGGVPQHRQQHRHRPLRQLRAGPVVVAPGRRHPSRGARPRQGQARLVGMGGRLR